MIWADQNYAGSLVGDWQRKAKKPGLSLEKKDWRKSRWMTRILYYSATTPGWFTVFVLAGLLCSLTAAIFLISLVMGSRRSK